MFEPSFDRVLCVEINEEKKTEAGILLPGGALRDTVEARVEAVGPSADAVVGSVSGSP